MLGNLTYKNMLLQREYAEKAYQSATRRQVFAFVFSVLFGASIVGGVFFIAYQVMQSGGVRDRESGALTPLITPVAEKSILLEEKKEIADEFFIFGELSSFDKTYRLYKVRAQPFSKEEIFSFLWSDTAILPEITADGAYLAVFFDSAGNGIILDTDGKRVPAHELAFQPPSAHFSVSPDGTRMLYFKYFSSLGTTGLFVRDMKKNEDVFAWPVGSEASRVCEFTGWSADNTKAYCAVKTKSGAEARVYDVKNFSWKAVAAAPQPPDDIFSGARPLVSFAHGALVLLESIASDDGAVRYFISQKDGLEKKELFTVSNDIIHSRYIGRFSRE